MRVAVRVVSALVAMCLSPPVLAQQAGPQGVIWHDRGDAAALDLVGGPGGKDHAPGNELRFIAESPGGTSPKFEVADEHGTTWKVKLGEEAKSETAATRLLWAAGYVVDEDYYRPEIRVLGLTRLDRGQEFVSRGGVVTGARLERKGASEPSTTWSWYDNPLLGTREFNGLRVMMALINNWDLKEVNNRVSETLGGGGQYGITDLGATFGRTGNSITRSKGVSKDYAQTSFVDKVGPTHVDFVLQSRPFFPLAVHFPNYRFRTRMESVVKHIPIADARWIGNQLGRLSAEQIRDCFRAAGFSPADVEAYAQVVTARIEILKNLSAPPPDSSTQTHVDVTGPGALDTTAARCLESTCRQVPVRETLAAINLKTAYARAIVGGFDQGAGIGGGVQLTSANAIRGLELRATALTSTRFYRRFDVGVFVPEIGSRRNHADLWFSHQQRDTDFYGIGSHTSPDLQSQFATRRRSYQGSLYRDFADHVQGGVYAQIMHTQSAPGEATPGAPIDELSSSAASEPVARSALRLNTQILSYGGFAVYDTRDNSNGLTRGVNIFGRVASAEGVGRHDASANYGWIETEIDARGFIPLGSARTSLALRSRNLLKTPRGEASQIPFYDLSWLGGRTSLRGYHSYRFRANNVALVSTELLQTTYAMSRVRGIDVFGFADAGQVWGDVRADTNSVILDRQGLLSRWHSGLGGGLQYRHSRSIAARVEVGRSDDHVLTYFSLSRGF